METPRERLRHAIALRERLAHHYADVALPNHISNGDDDRYATQNYFASFTKGLPHQGPLGEVDPAAYHSLLNALRSGAPEDFAVVPEGCTDATRQPFVDPQAGLAFDLEGIDSHLLTMPPAYEFSSAGQIGEIAENYWLGLCRDVPFATYDAPDPMIQAAAADLSRYSVFDGPKDASGAVTADTIFRAPFSGALLGPYLSQFLLLDVPYGAERFAQKVAYALPGTQDYMTTEASWLTAQNGCNPGPGPTLVMPATNQKFMYRGRELAQYVHIDELFQAYLNACLILISPPSRGGLGAPLNPGNPYPGSNQIGFGTLGEPNFKGMVAEVATRALKAVWYQKWFVHRRLRPEVFAARIHHWMSNTLGSAKYPFHRGEFTKLGAPPNPGAAIAGSVLARIFSHNQTVNGGQGTYLLPMAFPEGSPVHPSYGAGHATVAGACVTVLKAIFDGDTPIQPLLQASLGPIGGHWDVVMPDAGGTNLVAYGSNPQKQAQAARMTVGGELDKLAANIGIARNFAGVHWRSDDIESLKLGERVALEFLRETLSTYNEDVYCRLKLFDGSAVTITKTEVSQ